MGEHTPTPWRHANDGRLGCIVKDTPQGEIDIAMAQMRAKLGTKDLEREANAAFIVTAVNSHAALLAACEDMVKVAETGTVLTGDSHYALVARARAAIASAKQEPRP